MDTNKNVTKILNALKEEIKSSQSNLIIAIYIGKFHNFARLQIYIFYFLAKNTKTLRLLREILKNTIYALTE
jgi:hypothetical protein